MSPKKVGEGSVASDDTEYNYTCTFNLSQDTHVATSSKDNTHIFEGRFDVLTEKDGEKLYEWANTGEVHHETLKPFVQAETKKQTTVEDILAVFKKKATSDEVKTAMYDKVKEVCGKKNFMALNDQKDIDEVYDALVNFNN